MKGKLAALSVFALTFGMLQVPASALDFNMQFGRHDHNHDGRWNYREFSDANDYYYRNHPQAVIINSRDLRRDFNRLDADGDGYVRMDEVRTYHDW